MQVVFAAQRDVADACGGEGTLPIASLSFVRSRLIDDVYDGDGQPGRAQPGQCVHQPIVEAEDDEGDNAAASVRPPVGDDGSE